MTAEQIGALVSGAIPFLGGVYVTLLGFRVLGKKPGQDERFDAWHGRWGGALKVLGPLLIVFGLFLICTGRG